MYKKSAVMMKTQSHIATHAHTHTCKSIVAHGPHFQDKITVAMIHTELQSLPKLTQAVNVAKNLSQ